MTNDELDEALAEYKKATKKYGHLNVEYALAKSKDPALIQAKKEEEELYSKYCDAHEAWKELDNEFRDKHEALLESIYDAHHAQIAAQGRVNDIINRIIGANDEW